MAEDTMAPADPALPAAKHPAGPGTADSHTLNLTTVHDGVQKRRLKRRVGRGVGSGQGKTGGRGSKGQYASAGARLPGLTFIGGQTPLFRRVPKRGFNNFRYRFSANVVNVGDLDLVYQDGDVVTAESLRENGLATRTKEHVRILGDGELTKKLTVHADFFSKSAAEKIAAKGGTAELIPAPKKPVRNKMKPKTAKKPKAAV